MKNKKPILVVFMIIICLASYSQDTIYIVKGEEVIGKYATSDIDSMIFQPPTIVSHDYQTPNADFEAWGTSIGQGDSVSFIDTSYNEPTNWYWSFEGGEPTTSTERFPVVKYYTPGEYDVTLIVSNLAGKDTLVKDNMIKVINTKVAPVPQIEVNSSNVIIVNNSIQFLDNSKFKPTIWSWVFEGGTPSHSNQQNPIISYTDSGSFRVTLIVENQYGTDSLTLTNYVNVNDRAKAIDFNGELQVYPIDLPINGKVNWGNGNNVYINYTWSQTDGKTNTKNITNNYGVGSYAAYVCDTLNSFGHSDWYLPASKELDAIYANKEIIGGFSDTYYWSSSQLNEQIAYLIQFGKGTSYYHPKNYNAKVRCVRRP